ncbi:hypothetical protein GYH30_040162 [Glycine max]|nr:hypothetical protein GYH30_040162 [Glycine max]
MDYGEEERERFPEDVQEAELWTHFKKWGDVREIFISKQRNKGGRRYGFVRFKGVSDVSRLERQLNNTIIGGLKLHGNIPKYARGKLEKGKINHRRQGISQKKNEGTKAIPTTTSHIMAPTRTYAEILATHSRNAGQCKNTATAQVRQGGSHSSVQLDIPKEEDKWYKDAWVGRLKKLEIFERLEDEIVWILGSDVRPIYLGDDKVILPGLPDAKAEELNTEEIDKGTSLFYSLERWKPETRPGNRLVWMHCWGIPIAAWDIRYIRKIVATVGDLVDVDDEVEELRRLNRARILIRTPWSPTIHHSVTVDIHGVSSVVYMVEETSTEEGLYERRRRHTLSPSNEISSDDSGLDTPISQLSDLSTRLTAEEHTGGCFDPRSDRVSSGCIGINGPLGKDPYGPTLEDPMKNGTKRNQTGVAPDPLSELPACSSEKETCNQQDTDKADTKIESDVSRRGRKGSTEGIFQENKRACANAQNEEGIKCPPETRHLYFKTPLTPTTVSIGPENNIGLTSDVIEAEPQGCSANNHQHQQETGSA